MDAHALTDFSVLPIFHAILYEKEALKLKEGQSEAALDAALRNAALAAGIESSELDLPHALPDILSAAASPVRRSSVSANTQASCSTDITTPESPGSADDHDRFPVASPARHSISVAPPPIPYTRHSSSSVASIRSLKAKLVRRSSGFAKKHFSHDDESLRSISRHSSVHRFGSMKGRITYKNHPNAQAGSNGSVAEFDSESLALAERSRPSSSDSATSHQPQHTCNAPPTELQRAALKLAMEHPAFRDMWSEHSKTWERVAAFEVKQRRLLQFYEKFSRKTLTRQWESLKDNIGAKHSQDIERLEDRQVKADLALMGSQNDERLHSAAALKHMKAYCSGSAVPGSQKKRVVTEEDKQRLREQEKHHEELDRKHENARMMARARQEKELKDLKQSHEQQWKELDEKGQEARTALARLSHELSRQLEDLIHARRLRAASRWYISLKLWDKTTHEHDEVPPTHDIPSIPWPDQPTAEILAARSSSILDTYITFNNLPPAVSLLAPPAAVYAECSA